MHFSEKIFLSSLKSVISKPFFKTDSSVWKYVIRIILRNRVLNLVIIGVITLVMAFLALNVKLSYEMVKMLPAKDSTSLQYEAFRAKFGEDGSVMFVGVQDPEFWSLSRFNAWFDLSEKIRNIDGVEEVVSTSRIYRLIKNESTGKFDFSPVVKKRPETDAALDSLREIILSMPIYQGLLHNSDSGVYLMAITLDKNKLNTKSRVALIDQIDGEVNAFAENNRLKLHLSGLPYIRTVTSKTVQSELYLFLALSIFVAATFLFLFFKSFRAVLIPLLAVAISVIWALGTIALFQFKITILTGIIPPLLIVIGVENCIFLLNKYHNEYLSHGNKVRSLARTIHRIGNANLLTNLSTAVGFASFIPTGNKLLVEFGIVAALNVMLAFFLSLVLIPILFSFLSPPSPKHLRHLEKGFVKQLLDRIIIIVKGHRNKVYVATGIAIVLAVFGVVQLNTSGRILDDISKRDPLYKDLMFFERHFRGVMPFEIAIDTKKKRGVLKLSTIQKIDDFQQELAKYPEFSKPLSVAEVIKYARQSFYNGDPYMYGIPNDQEKNFILSYLPSTKGKKTILNAFIDSTMQVTRISVQMANVTTPEIQRIKSTLQPVADSIFPKEKFNVTFTGTSVVFLKGTNFLVNDLFVSLIIAIVVISAIMALLFSSFRMILISLIPNLIPQLLTAAMMGYLGIPIKPSTILIFSIALGISVDNTIQFLSRYRLTLKVHHKKIGVAVIAALKETGFSMIYSSSVLFFGFGIFVFSTFGGTQAIGYLISFTLFIALICNLFLIPSLILTLDKWSTARGFVEPILELKEEDDVEVDKEALEIAKSEPFSHEKKPES